MSFEWAGSGVHAIKIPPPSPEPAWSPALLSRLFSEKGATEAVIY